MSLVQVWGDHMVKHFLEEDIQIKIKTVSLGIVGDGETLERSLECLRKAINSPAEHL